MTREGVAAFVSSCTGASDCAAEQHIHGCFADTGNCNEPEEHRSAALGRGLTVFALLLLALSFGALLAWFSVEWPQPLPLIPRVLGWVFFPSLTVMGGVALWKAR